MELIAVPNEAENTHAAKICKSLDHQIVSSCTAYFDLEEEVQKALVLLTSSNLLFYFDSGENYITALPFEVQSIYPVKGGILVEGTDSSSRLFTLFHPNEHVKPVSVCDQLEEFDLGSVLLVRDEYLVSRTADKIRIYNILYHNNSSDLDIELEDSIPSFEEEELKSNLKLKLLSDLEVKISIDDVVFINTDSDLQSILWILQKTESSLRGYAIQSEKAIQLYSYRVQDACEFECPIASGYLALMLDGTIKMWMGYKAMIPCNVDLSQLQAKPRTKRDLNDPKASVAVEAKLLKGIRVTGLQKSSENGSIVLKFSDNTQTTARANITFHSTLISSCVQQIEYVVSAEEFVVFYSRVMFTTYGAINKTEQLSSWESFVVALLSFLHVDLDSNSKIVEGEEDGDYEWLVNHPIGERFPELILRNLNIDTGGRSKDRLFCISARLYRQCHNEPTLLRHSNQLILAFHLVYQDLLLDVSLKSQLQQMGELMSRLLTGNQLQNYYRGLGYSLKSHHYTPINLDLDIKSLPTITDWIYDVIATQAPEKPITTVLNTISNKPISFHNSLNNLKEISTLFNVLFKEGAHKMIEYFVSNDFKVNIDHLPTFVALPLRQAIYKCRHSPQNLADNQAACVMIGRHDLAKNHIEAVAIDKDERDRIVQLRFGKDNRIVQVHELLNPIADAVIEVQLKANMSIEEVSTAQQSALTQWAVRPFAFSLGNALLNFESSAIVPTEVFAIPKLKKSARISPMNSLIELASTPQNDAFVDWPEFHTGVAAALQIRADCQDVDSSWIVFNQIKSAEGSKNDTSHAGFIYGLGLLGHLKKLDSSDSLRNYFLPQHEILSVGHLLGLAAAHLGSRHPQITNMLSVHLPSMLPNQSIELNTGFVLKTGAMIGYGLLHFNHPSQYKFDKVFSEIEQVQVTENSVENSGNGSYLIGCGFSLGFIGLGSVTNFKSSEQLVEKLLPKLKEPKSSCEAISLAIALGLICLRSESTIASDALAIPVNEFLLDWFPPEVLMVRVICRCLIMWKAVEPTKDWIKSQIPLFLVKSVKDRPLNLSPNNEHRVHSYFSILGGLCFAIGLKFASTGDNRAVGLINEYFDEIAPLSNQFSYGEKLFAGVARNALNAIMSSLCMVLAGSGNMEYFQKLQTVHEKASVEISYGSHMAASMSIGLLFLASGSATIATSNKAIATLFCSFFPLYPSTPTDNRHHLQALRHLWVLAIDRRCVITRDVETGDIVTVPIEVNVDNASADPEKETTPAILPPFDRIKSIKILGPRYWELDLDFDNLKDQSRNVTIWVQRKSQYLSYSDDPDGKRGILASSFPKLSPTSNQDRQAVLKKRERFISSFSSHPEVLAFIRYLCLVDLESEDHEQNQLAEFSMKILYECLCLDKMEMVPIYVSLFQDMRRILAGSNPTLLDTLSMKIVLEFVKQCQFAEEECILDATFADWLRHDITKKWTSSFVELIPAFGKYYLETGSLPSDLTAIEYQEATAYLEFFQWPKRQDLELLKQNSHLIQPSSLSKSAFLLKQLFPRLSAFTLRQILSVSLP